MEVLIVIAIIGILAGIMFVATGGTREAARQSSCMNNFKQLYMAWAMYSTDNPGNPANPHAPEMATVELTSLRALHDYVGSVDVWHCPSAEPWMRKTFFSTYVFALHKPVWPAEKAQRDEQYTKYGAGADAIVCRIHEELYYQPRRDVADDLRVGSRLIVLDFTGRTRVVNRPEKRYRQFTRDLVGAQP